MVRHERFGPRFAGRHIATQFPPSRAKVLDFAAFLGRTIERRVGQLVVVDWNAKPRPEFTQLFLIEFFLLVSDVPALTAFSEAIALDRSSEDDGRRPGMID